MTPENLNNLKQRYRQQLENAQAENDPSRREIPEEGQSWTENDTGDLYTVKNVDRWESGSITVHCINVPLMRMWSGPMESFIDKFQRVKG